jgi:hypothetical protein
MNENDEIEVKAGFLIVKTYPAIYSDYVGKYELQKDFYGLPRKDFPDSKQIIQYRGIDRDALDPYKDSDNLSEIQMDELEKIGKCSDGFLFDLSTAQEILDLLDDKQINYEIIWARTVNSNVAPPVGFESIGFEPTYFVGDHFSASCDCMVIPRWHGTDDEGTLFLEHFKKLNQYGLFNNPADAKLFLEYYLSFDWTETGDYEIAELFISPRTEALEGKTLKLDEKAESASKNLPAFLAKPDGAPVYYGFPLLKESEIEGWILGIITEFEDENGCEEGDAYVVAPNGDRIGIVWDVGVGQIETVCEPNNERAGVFQVWFPKVVKTKEDMIDNFRCILPQLKKKYEELKKQG